MKKLSIAIFVILFGMTCCRPVDFHLEAKGHEIEIVSTPGEQMKVLRFGDQQLSVDEKGVYVLIQGAKSYDKNDIRRFLKKVLKK